MVDPVTAVATIIVVLLIILIILSRSVYQIQPYQQGVRTLLGSYKDVRNPGLNFVSPLSTIIVPDPEVKGWSVCDVPFAYAVDGEPLVTGTNPGAVVPTNPALALQTRPPGPASAAWKIRGSS